MHDADRSPPRLRRQAWIWPLAVPRRVARRALDWGHRLADVAARRRTWIAWAATAGLAPILVCYGLGLPAQHLLAAALLAPLLLAAVARDNLRLGIGVLAVAFVAHNAATIALAAYDPAGMAEIFPAGADYWERSRHWILTGEKPEYDVRWWLPEHGRLLCGVGVFTYTSLGFLTLWQGFYEVDLMNYYVGQLVVHSRSPWQALLLGWHPWSACRGLGYLLITFEVASLSFSRLTGARLSTAARRGKRWAAGLALLGLDVGIKYCCTDLVRAALYENLL